MTRPLRLEFEGAYYHVMARGNERKPIFLDDADRELFLELMARAATRHAFIVHAYALMPNHIHILLETPLGGLSRGMHGIHAAYSQRFNRKYMRVGHLFQGRFKSLLIDKNSYWKAVSRYIHQNPVKGGLAKRAWDYPWSSCRQVLGLDARAPWLNAEMTLGFFGDDGRREERYRRFLERRIEADPWERAAGQAFLGSEEFIERMRREARPVLRRSSEFAHHAELGGRPSPEAVVTAVRRRFGADADRRCWGNPSPKMVEILFLRELAGMPLKETADRHGMRPTAVSQALRRFETRVARDIRLAAAVRGLRAELVGEG